MYRLKRAEEAWAAVKTFWSPFDFMFGPGVETEEIETWEKNQGVRLGEDVRAVIQTYSSIGIPTALHAPEHSAEISLEHPNEWRRLDRSELVYKDDPDFWTRDVFTNKGWPSASMKNYVVVGCDLWGEDYGVYTLLHVPDSSIFGFTFNTCENPAYGNIFTWLAETRLSDMESVAEYPKPWIDDNSYTDGTSLAQLHSTYLEGSSGRLHRWKAVEQKFIKAFDSL